MNRIDELIAELCPEGVKFQSIGDVVEFRRGKRVVRKNLANEGELEYPVYQNSLIPLGYFGESNAPAESAFIIVAGAAGDIGFSAVDYWAADDCFYAHCPDFVDDRFLYHFLLENQRLLKSRVRKASIPRLPRASIEKLKFPVPPLEVQRVIVDILDQFVKLEAELEAELEARKRQYEYYRRELLTFGEDVEWSTLGDVSLKVISGGTPSSGKSSYYGGSIPWLRTQEVDFRDIHTTSMTITDAGLENSSAKWIPADCVIVAMYGATAAKSAINKIPLTTNQACCNLQINPSKAEYRYVFHWVAKEYENLRNLGEGSQSNINAKKVREFSIPLPSLDEQRRIVEVLDKFDALVNDLSSGLPAEIAARRKQYEYYRDQLLTFKELKS
ncbi:restriction endonuclease subunit S [Corynebacterium ulcerans]|uniref:restriction endonuclease subunit S n=1 Tax=Corynebacterium ulcerans TaxID=65058 RepID=UPI000C760999|nr:restriction endonuclease subunit S [Corynebacterium ulcerans]PLW01593.1 hypothetical protein BRL54_10135 [Corynebacterium ulcerans]